MNDTRQIEPIEDEKRRSFLCMSAVALGGLGTAYAAWPLFDSMNPAADVTPLYPAKIDMASIPEGQSLTVAIQGWPIFIRHRTPAEIEAARNVDLAELPYPERDSDRVLDPRWIAVVGVCSAPWRCVLNGQKAKQFRGTFDGWWCPCCASHYDTSGRFRRGIAPKNLRIPDYDLLNGTTLAFRSVPRTPWPI